VRIYFEFSRGNLGWRRGGEALFLECCLVGEKRDFSTKNPFCWGGEKQGKEEVKSQRTRERHGRGKKYK